MTITFYSNFLNHHQLSLCNEFINIIGLDNFKFVASQKIDYERIEMGYEDMNVKYSFVIKAYESEAELMMAKELAKKSDVAIMGANSNQFCKIRMKVNKLTFRFSERFFKNGTWHRFIPTTAYTIYKNYTLYREKSLYVLCASAYLAEDLALLGFPKSKCFRWGYFPAMKFYEGPVMSLKSSYKIELLWVGRMIWWKHPEDAVYTLDYLLKKGLCCHLTMIGEGKKRKEVEALSRKLGIQENILFKNFCSEQEVRRYMEYANIYIFSSGREEGWGAVLNEAMNSGCLVVANEHAGSTPFLIQQGKNGLVYKGSHHDLMKCLDMIVEDKSIISKMGEQAYFSICEIWNYRVAANNFVKLSQALMNNDSEKSILFGPGSAYYY